MKKSILKTKSFKVKALIILTFTVSYLPAYSLFHALSQPTNDSLAAKTAEWARDNHLGFIVTNLEKIQYKLNPVKVGGNTKVSKLANNSGTNLPISLPTIVNPPLTLEGKYQSVVSKDNIPVISVAMLRPDRLHTSYLTSVAYINLNYAKIEQHPGLLDPGNKINWGTLPKISQANNSGYIAAFNSGFRLKDSMGGYYQNNHLLGKMTPNSASFIIYKDGRVAIKKWQASDVITNDISSIRQNIAPLILNGKVNIDINKNVYYKWGATVSSNYAVWRSGIGIDKFGNLIYATGDALSAASLANILLRAGSVNAMELDINADWTSFYYYTQGIHNSLLLSHKINNFSRPNNRYFYNSSRDFFAVKLK